METEEQEVWVEMEEIEEQEVSKEMAVMVAIE